jgi:hypothetical protein
MVLLRGGGLALMFAMALISAVACRGLMPRNYEYEEDLYLALDGSATLYVNSSVAALAALRGLPLDDHPRARLDRDALRDAYTSAATRVTRVSSSRRSGRRFVHLRVDVADVRRLAEAGPFAWSSYSLRTRQDAVVFKQVVGASAGRRIENTRWNGSELVAFRLHLPSKIRYHDAPSKRVERGNIVAWEQPLQERLEGRPVSIEVRLDTHSILYRTLWLFGSMVLLVAAVFGIVIWWIVRKGRAAAAATGC